jgi:hypothetical protein
MQRLPYCGAEPAASSCHAQQPGVATNTMFTSATARGSARRCMSSLIPASRRVLVTAARSPGKDVPRNSHCGAQGPPVHQLEFQAAPASRPKSRAQASCRASPAGVGAAADQRAGAAWPGEITVWPRASWTRSRACRKPRSSWLLCRGRAGARNAAVDEKVLHAVAVQPPN